MKVFVVIILLLHTQIASGQVNPTLDTGISSDQQFEPLISKNVRLNCTVTGSCCTGSTREWSKNDGTGNFIALLTDGISSNNAKYEENLLETSNQFNLIIKNFDEKTDLGTYRCSYGFIQQDLDLQMSEGLHYIPSDAEMSETFKNFSHSSSTFSYSVNLTSVYPAPSSCSCLYNGDDLTSSLSISNGDNGVLKYAEISLSNVNQACQGVFSITCDIGIYTGQQIVSFTPCTFTSTLATSSTSRLTSSSHTTVSNIDPSDESLCSQLCKIIIITVVSVVILCIVIPIIVWEKNRKKIKPAGTI